MSISSQIPEITDIYGSSGADANSTSAATIANADIATALCFVDIIRTILLYVVV